MMSFVYVGPSPFLYEEYSVLFDAWTPVHRSNVDFVEAFIARHVNSGSLRSTYENFNNRLYQVFYSSDGAPFYRRYRR